MLVKSKYWASSLPFVWHFKGQCDQGQGLQGEALCPRIRPGGFPFHTQLKL